jgi:predicted PurR-regulated permease PerM
MKIDSKFIRDFFLLILLIALGVALFRVIEPFLALITIALILVQLFLPVYKFFFKGTKSKLFSSLLSTLFVVIIILIPGVILFIIAAQDVFDLVALAEQSIRNSGLLEPAKLEELKILIKTQLENYGLTEELKNIDIYSLITNPGLISTIADNLFSILGGVVNLLISLIMIIILMIFLFMEYERIPEILSKYSPLDNSIDKLFFEKFEKTSLSVIRGSLIIAAAQATVVILPMAAFHIPGLALWWIIMFVVSVLPLGSGFVWLPVGIFMIASPAYSPFAGLFLILYGAISINLVDSILRPLLTKGGTGLHPLLALLSALGGLVVFQNPLGLLYGPLIAVFYKTVIEIYQEKFYTDK